MKANNTNRRRLPESVAQAIETVLDHFWQNQAQDYLACKREAQETHIFTEMLHVRQWLKARRPIGRNNRDA
jgi:hypothetical protein